MIPSFSHIHMQCDNTTPIEGLFNKTRACNKDWTHHYAGNITNKSTRAMAAGACQAGSSYNKNDCVEFDGRTDCGSRAFYAHRRGNDEKLTRGRRPLMSWQAESICLQGLLVARSTNPSSWRQWPRQCQVLLSYVVATFNSSWEITHGRVGSDSVRAASLVQVGSTTHSPLIRRSLIRAARMSCDNSSPCTKALATISRQVRKGRSLTSSWAGTLLIYMRQSCQYASLITENVPFT